MPIRPPIDLLLRGGPIFDRPDADAVAISGDLIVAVGSSAELSRGLVAGSRVVELRGRPVLPGFVDAHVHLEYYARSRHELNLEDASSPEEVARLVGERARGTPDGTWLQGRGWLRDRLGRWPTAADLDPSTPRHPVALASHDTHALWVNSRALAEAGLGPHSEDPPGGEIMWLAESAGDRRPSGLLLEEAQAPIHRAIARSGQSGGIGGLAEVVAQASALGLVGVHDFEGRRARTMFRQLREAGRLTLRVTMGVSHDMLADDAWRELYDADDWLRTGPVKLFADGALGSRTAFMLAPYETGSGGELGIARLEQDELLRLVRVARGRGLGVAVHAIGDAAVRRVLDAFETSRADDAAPARHQLLRIEHAQLVDPDDLPRFARLGVVASMQPNHCPSDRPVAEAAWGTRCRHAYAWRALAEAGAILAFGTDCPVEPLDPLLNLHAAVTRQDADDEPAGGWYPEQRLDLERAIRAYTLGPAIASGDSRRRGSIAPGKLADLVVLSQSIAGRGPRVLRETRVDMTIVGGRVVYETA